MMCMHDLLFIAFVCVRTSTDFLQYTWIFRLDI